MQNYLILNLALRIETARLWNVKPRKLRNIHTNIATYTNQKPRFNTVIKKLQNFDTSAYHNRRRVQPEEIPTRETHPPNTNNSGHQKQLPITPLPNTI